MQQLKKMGPLNNLVGMLPGMPKEIRDVEIDDREINRIEAIIKSMTPAERTEPGMIDASRRARIAAGSGTNPAQVSGLVSQFSEMRKMMKRFGGMGTKKPRRDKRKKKGKGKKGGGGRVTPKGGGRQQHTGRTTPKGTKSTKSPLMLPGLDRLDESDLEKMAQRPRRLRPLVACGVVGAVFQLDGKRHLSSEAGRHRAVFVGGQINEPFGHLLLQAGGVDYVFGPDGRVVGRSAVEAIALELNPVGNEVETALADHLHHVECRTRANGVQQQLHRIHTGFGPTLAVDHHLLTIGDPAQKPFVGEVKDSCLLGRRSCWPCPSMGRR